MESTSTGGAGQFKAEAANGQTSNGRSCGSWEGATEGGRSLSLIHELKSPPNSPPPNPSKSPSGRQGVSPPSEPSEPSGSDLDPEQGHLLADIAPTLEKWADAVRDTRRFAKWLRLDSGLTLEASEPWGKLSYDMATCGERLEFRKVLSGSLAGATRLHSAIFCQHKTVCRMCAIRRASKVLAAYVPKLQTVCRSIPKRGSLIFATLTQQTGPHLGERLASMQDALSKLVKRRHLAISRAAPHPLKAIAGGVFSVEIKRGTGSGEWHVHAHGLLACDSRLQYDAFRRTWADILGQDNAQNCLKRLPHDDPDRLLGAALETFKYAVKFDSHLGDADRLDVYGSTYRKRLVRSFGCFRGVEVPEELTDEPLDWDAVEWAALVLRYRDGSFVPSRPTEPEREALFDAWNAQPPGIPAPRLPRKAKAV